MSFSVIKLLQDSGTLGRLSGTLDEMNKYYSLPNLVGSLSRAGGSFTKWMIDVECTNLQADILSVGAKERGVKKIFLGVKGTLSLKAALKSSDPMKSFEDLIILKVLASKLDNLTRTLIAINSQGFIECYCDKIRGKKIGKLKGKSTKISSKSIPSTLKEAFLVHCECPEIVPLSVSPNNPTVISALVYNEIYRVYHALRATLQIWINESSKGLSDIVTLDPYEVSDRMGREITRGFEELGLLQQLRGRVRCISIPDRLLCDLVSYFEETVSRETSGGKVKSKDSMTLARFVRMIKGEYRILIDPHDIIDFLRNSVNYRSLGVDLNTAVGYLIADYRAFTERLETLGLAMVRPDGDVVVHVK